VHYRQHWIRRIEAKLDVPLAEAAAPDALVGRVVHKPAAAFGRGGRGGVLLAGLVTGCNAGRLTWSAKYDDEMSQSPEELGAADMGLYGPGVDAGDAGDEAHRHRGVLSKGVPTSTRGVEIQPVGQNWRSDPQWSRGVAPGWGP
jgi:hypothetical protein